MSVYKLKNGRWHVRIDEESVGRRKRVSLGTFTKKADAEKAERDAKSAKERGVPFAPSKQTLDALFARFVTDAKHRNLSPKTIQEYEAKWNLYVKPRLGNLAVTKLKPAMLSEFYAEIRERGGRDRKSNAPRPISAPTVRHVANLLSSVLKWAYRLEIIPRNVADFVEPPKGGRTARGAYQVDQAVKLLAEADKTRHGPLVWFAFATGLRRGELCALKWSDISFARNVAVIRGSIGEVKGRTFYKDVKQGRAKSIALSDTALEALRRQKALSETDRERLRGLYGAGDYVFARPEGGHMTPNSIGQAVRRIARRAELPLTAMHSMRHSTASWLIADGVDIQTVSAVLRHSSASTTLAIYAHEITGAQAEAVGGIGKRLRNAKPEPKNVRDLREVG